jgi:acyl-CoA thioesterase
MFSLVDIAMGLACSSTHGFDQQSATIECKINYIRAVATARCCAPPGDPPGRGARGRGRRDQGDKLVAKAQGTFAVL